jgi:UDP-glucose 4-epimerase
MRYLVTGGAGFVGSHLVDRLAARGAQVVVLDDLSTGLRSNLAEVGGQRGAVELIEGSVLDPDAVAAAIERCEAVFHLAGVVGVRRVAAEPLEALRVNVDGSAVVLAAAAASGASVVLASSSEVYGTAPRVPCREDDPLPLADVRAARTAYAASKAMAECLGFAHAARSGLRFLAVRLFNTVGPRQRGRFGMVLPRFVDQAVAGRPLTVYGDGDQTRCFAHVADVVDGILALVDRGAYGSVFNLGSDVECSILELATRVRDAVGSTSPIVRLPFAEARPGLGDDVRRRVPDLSRVRATVGARPARALDAVVADVVRDRAARAVLAMPLAAD